MQRGFVAGVRIATKCSNSSFKVATATAAPKNNIYKSASYNNINSQQQSSTSNIPASFSTTTSSSLVPPSNRNNTIKGSSILSNFKFNSFLVISDDDDGS